MRGTVRYSSIGLLSILMTGIVTPLANGAVNNTTMRAVNGAANAGHFNAKASGQYFVRAGSFSSERNARNYRIRLSNMLRYPVNTKKVGRYYVVAVGPMRTAGEVRLVGNKIAAPNNAKSNKKPYFVEKPIATSVMASSAQSQIHYVSANSPNTKSSYVQTAINNPKYRKIKNQKYQAHYPQRIFTNGNERSKLIRREHKIRFHHRNLPYTSISIFSPVGYGPNWGTVYGVGMGVNRWPGGTQSDGALIFGMGLGDSDRYIGGSLNLLIDSLGLRSEGFGQNSALGGSITRWLGPNTGVSVGASVLAGTGVFRNSANGYFASGTQLIPLTPHSNYSRPLAITLGIGSGNFVSPEEFRIFKQDKNITGFGAVSFSPVKQLSLIGDYTEQVLSLGASWLPLKRVPMWLTGYATNIAGANTAPGPVTYGLRIGFAYVFT